MNAFKMDASKSDHGTSRMTICNDRKGRLTVAKSLWSYNLPSTDKVFPFLLNSP